MSTQHLNKTPQVPPTITLPSWAVNDEILTAIQDLVSSVIMESGDANGKGEKVLHQIAAMGSYIRNGVWSC